MSIVSSRVVMVLALFATVGCSDNKKQPEGVGATSASAAVASATPSVAATASAIASASAAASAAVTAASTGSTASAASSAGIASAAMVQGAATLRAKYEPLVRELGTAVLASVMAEKRKQDGDAGAKKFTRLPLPASKLGKDASVLQVDVINTRVMTVSVHALNAAKSAGGGQGLLKVPATGDTQARCPSLYTNEPAIDLLFNEPVVMAVAVKSDLCDAQAAERDREVARVKKLVEPNVKAYLDHAARTPDPCEAGKAQEPALSDDLKKLGVRRARVQCRKVDHASWQAFGIRETDYIPAKTVTQPAWRTTAAKLQQPLFYLSDDAATGKPYLLTFGATRADGVELETEFYLQ